MQGTQFMPGVPAMDRIDALRAEAAKVSEGSYYVQLTQEELDARRERFTDICIEIAEKIDELNNIKAEYKEALKPMQEARATLMANIKTRQEERMGVTYDLVNHETGMMDQYDADGLLISTRRLTPDERKQNRIQFTPNKKTVNGQN